MNKNAIKKFTTEARRELIFRVRQKASKYGIVPGDKSVNPSADSYEGYVFSPTEKEQRIALDRKSTRLNSSHVSSSYAVFCLKQKKSNRAHNGYKRIK